MISIFFNRAHSKAFIGMEMELELELGLGKI